MKESDNSSKPIERIISRFAYYSFIYFIGIVLTLAMHDGYYDLMGTKAVCFFYGMKLLLPLMLIVLFIKIRSKQFRIHGLFEYALIFFFITNLISTFLSGSIIDAFTGQKGFYIGSFTVCSLIFVYFVLKDEEKVPEYVYIPLILVSGTKDRNRIINKLLQIVAR